MNPLVGGCDGYPTQYFTGCPDCAEKYGPGYINGCQLPSNGGGFCRDGKGDLQDCGLTGGGCECVKNLGGGTYCGNSICEAGEDCSNCPQDCGICPSSGEYCGDHSCNNGETCSSCPDDCACSGPVNGACGTADYRNKIYEATDTSFGSDTLCASGTPIPVNPSTLDFPAPGGSIRWYCQGINGGKNGDYDCYAFRNLPLPPSSAGCDYVGCYTDDSSRALPVQLGAGVAQSRESCVALAKAAGYAYAGLQNGDQCFAGNTLGYTKVSDSECNKPCAANSNEVCGGPWRNSICQVTPTVVPPPTSTSVTCNSSGQATINWTLPSGYTQANVRVHTNDCRWESGNMFVALTTQGSPPGQYTFAVSPGQQYCYWVETSQGSGYSSPAGWTSFTCSPPSISLSSLLDVTAQVGDPAPLSQSLTITNSGGTTLNWTGTNNTPSICTLNRTTGTAGANNSAPDTIKVLFAPPTAGMVATSPNNCTITISDQGGVAASKQAGNTYTVTPGTPNPPTGGGDCNSQTSCPGGGGGSPPSGGGPFVGGGTPVCSVVRLEWTDGSTNETAFKLYKSSTNSFPGASGLLATVVSTTQGGTGQIYGYDYNLSGDTAVYYYWATSFGPSGESAPLAFSSVASYACGNANLGDSEKNIIAVNGNNISPVPGQCNGFVALPSNVTLNLGDNLKFRIDLCNDQGSAPATNITVTDTLNNLQKPTGTNPQTGLPYNDFSAYYNDSLLTYDNACAATPHPAQNHYCVSGTAPSQTLTFNLTAGGDNIAGKVGNNPGGIAYLTFTAQLATFTPGQSQSRFKNDFIVNYNTSQNFSFSTGWLPFYTGKGYPTILEVP